MPKFVVEFFDALLQPLQLLAELPLPQLGRLDLLPGLLELIGEQLNRVTQRMLSLKRAQVEPVNMCAQLIGDRNAPPLRDRRDDQDVSDQVAARWPSGGRRNPDDGEPWPTGLWIGPDSYDVTLEEPHEGDDPGLWRGNPDHRRFYRELFTLGKQ